MPKEDFRGLCDRALQDRNINIPNLAKDNLEKAIRQLKEGDYIYLSWWAWDGRWRFYAHMQEVGSKLYESFKAGERTYKPRLLDVFTLADLVRHYQKA